MSKAKNARDLMAELQSDASFADMSNRRDARMQSIELECDSLRRPVLEHIARMGYRCSTLTELAETHSPLPDAVVQVLLDAIARSDNERVQESYIRAISAADSEFDGSVFTKIYRHTQSEGLKFAILNAIALTHPTGVADLINDLSVEARKLLENLGFKASCTK